MAGSTLSFGMGTVQSSNPAVGTVTVQERSGTIVNCINPAGLAINVGDHVLFAVITNPVDGSNTTVILKNN